MNWHFSGLPRSVATAMARTRRYSQPGHAARFDRAREQFAFTSLLRAFESATTEGTIDWSMMSSPSSASHERFAKAVAQKVCVCVSGRRASFAID